MKNPRLQFKSLLEPKNAAALGLVGVLLLSASFANASLFGNGTDPGSFPGTVLPIVGGTATLSNNTTGGLLTPITSANGTGSVTSNPSSFFNQPTLTSTGVLYNGSIPSCGIFCEITNNRIPPTNTGSAVSYFGTTYTNVNNTPISPTSRPVINSLSPSSGRLDTRVTISGNNFSATGNRIRFGNLNSETNPEYSLNSTDGRTITFTIPSYNFYTCQLSTPRCYPAVLLTQPGTYSVSVINSLGVSNEVLFTVLSDQSPTTYPPTTGGSYFGNADTSPILENIFIGTPIVTDGAQNNGGRSYFGNSNNSIGVGTGVLIPINTNANGGVPATPIIGSTGVGFFGNTPTQPYNQIDLFNPHPNTVATPVSGSSGVGLFGNTPTTPYNVIDLFNVRPAGGSNGNTLFPITTGSNGVITTTNGVDLFNVRPAGGTNGNTLFPVTNTGPVTQTVQLLRVSCAPSTTQAAINQIISWNAGISGGIGTYTASWTGTDGLAGNGLQLSGGYTTPGTKSATVTVTSGSQIVSAACSINIY